MHFGIIVTKKFGVNHFLNFNKGFFGQRKLFSVWPPFYSETNFCKSKNIFRKIFYRETNGALREDERKFCKNGYLIHTQNLSNKLTKNKLQPQSQRGADLTSCLFIYLFILSTLCIFN